MAQNATASFRNQNARHSEGRVPAAREKLRRLWLFIRDNDLTGLDGTIW